MSRSMWDEMNDLPRSFDQWFDNLTYSRPRRDDSEHTFSPGVETCWTMESLNLRFVVPGVSEQDLRITIQGNQLVVQGERKMPERYDKAGSAYLQANSSGLWICPMA